MMAVLVFCIGLVIGSFFNVVAIRVPQNMSVVFPASHCVYCGQPILKKDLVPVLSYIWLRGRSRCCQQRIDALYPFGELAPAILFTLIYFTIRSPRECVVGWLFTSGLIILSISDIRYMLVPNRIVYPFAAAVALIRVMVHPLPLWDYYAAAAAAFAVMFLIKKVSAAMIGQEGLGGGDVRLFAYIGLAIGLQGVAIAFFLAVCIGAFAGLLLRASGALGRHEPFPFAPFIAMGAFVSYLWGTPLANAYFSLIGI